MRYAVTVYVSQHDSHCEFTLVEREREDDHDWWTVHKVQRWTDAACDGGERHDWSIDHVVAAIERL